MMDESEADPFSWSLYKLILQWTIEDGDVYVWIFTILQWNCMARSINIGELAYHIFLMGEDSIKYNMIEQRVIKQVKRLMTKTYMQILSIHLYALFLHLELGLV